MQLLCSRAYFGAAVLVIVAVRCACAFCKVQNVIKLPNFHAPHSAKKKCTKTRFRPDRDLPQTSLDGKAYGTPCKFKGVSVLEFSALRFMALHVQPSIDSTATFSYKLSTDTSTILSSSRRRRQRDGTLRLDVELLKTSSS